MQEGNLQGGEGNQRQCFVDGGVLTPTSAPGAAGGAREVSGKTHRVLIANGILMIRLLARWRIQGPVQGLQGGKELAGLWWREMGASN